MIVLDTTTRKIEVLLGGTATTSQLPIVASYMDYGAGVLFTPGANETVSNNTTAVTAVASPTGTNVRQVKYICVQNADTVAETVTVRYNDNGTTRNMAVITLSVGDQLIYEDGEGWRVISSAGNIRMTIASFSSGQVTSGFIGNASVNSGNISSGAIGQFALSSGCVTSGDIGNQAVVSGSIASGAIGQFALSSGCVVSGDIGNNAVVSGSIASGQISAILFASGSFIGQSGIVVNQTLSGVFISVSGINIQSGGLASGLINSGNSYNYLINGGMWFGQRATTSLFGSINYASGGGADQYTLDRWKVGISPGSSGSQVVFLQVDRTNSGIQPYINTNISDRYLCSFYSYVSGNKFSVYQPLEATNSYDIQGAVLTFQCKMLVLSGPQSSGAIYRMGILQTVSGTAPDSIPNPIATSYNSATSGTDPSWNTGVALLAPPTTCIPNSSGWTVFTNVAQHLSGGVNLIAAIWANQALNWSASSGSNALALTEAGLYAD